MTPKEMGLSDEINQMRVKFVHLQFSRLKRAKRLYMTKPLDRRRLKRALRLRRLVHAQMSAQTTSTLSKLGVILAEAAAGVSAMTAQTSRVVSAFDAFGDALAKVREPATLITESPPCRSISIGQRDVRFRLDAVRDPAGKKASILFVDDRKD